MTGEEKGSRKRAIRLKCLDCCCGSAYEVRLCPLRNCPLWRFRLGTQCREETRENAADFQHQEEKGQEPDGEAVFP